MVVEETTMLYRCPGSNPAGSGHTYDWRGVKSEAEADMLVKDGWSRTMSEAIQAHTLSQPDTDVVLDESMTPAEKKAAAEKALASAAERSLVAKRELEGATSAAEAAGAELSKTATKAVAALEALNEAVSAEKSAAAEKSQAAAKAAAANKELASCKLRALATAKSLDDAAGKVLLTDKLLSDATEKALAQAEAAEKAMAAASKKPAKPEPESPEDEAAEAKAEAEPGAAAFEDTRAALNRLKAAVDMKAVTALLKKFGVAKSADLTEDQYADVIAAADKAAAKAEK